MATNLQNPLADLKPLHLPSKVSWWPLAPGWYLLLMLIIIVGLAALWYYCRVQKKRKVRNEINKLWLDMENSYLGNPSPEIIAGINVFLKRVALKYFANDKPQLLSGDAWLNFLDNSGKTTAFSNGVGKLLANPYRKIELVNPTELFAVIRDYLKVVL